MECDPDKVFALPTQNIICDMRMPEGHLLAQRDYIKDIHKNLLEGQIEQNTPEAAHNYFNMQPDLTPEDRKILVNWLMVVQVEFKLLPETMQATVSFIDRYLCRVETPIIDF